MIKKQNFFKQNIKFIITISIILVTTLLMPTHISKMFMYALDNIIQNHNAPIQKELLILIGNNKNQIVILQNDINYLKEEIKYLKEEYKQASLANIEMLKNIYDVLEKLYLSK